MHVSLWLRARDLQIRSLNLVVLVAVCGSSVAACGSGSRAAGAGPFAPSILGLQSWRMNTCGAVAPKATVRIKLDDSIDIGALSRKVEYAASKPDDDESDTWGRTLGGGSPPAGKIRPLHIDRADMDGVVAGDWVLVRVVLYDSRFTFEGADNSTDPIQGIVVNTMDKDPEFCSIAVQKLAAGRKGSGDAQRNREVASFMFMINKLGASRKGYSIILLPKNLDDTPIIIDPKILNNG